jgi:hypothetical protein
MNCLGKLCVVVDVNPDGGNSVTVIGQLSVYRPDWMRKPNCVVNDCRETDADEEQDDDRSRGTFTKTSGKHDASLRGPRPTSNVVVVIRP